MTPQFHERQVLRLRVRKPDNQQLMRVRSVRFNPDPDESRYLVEPCVAEFPYKPDPRSGSLRHLSGAQLHERYEAVGEAPV